MVRPIKAAQCPALEGRRSGTLDVGAELGGEGGFIEGSAKNHDGIAEPTEEEMSALVNDQINVVEEEKSGAVSEGVKEEECVKTEPGDSGDTGNGLPVAEFFFEEGHWRKGSKGDLWGEAVRKEVFQWEGQRKRE